MSFDRPALLRRSPFFEMLSEAELQLLGELSRPRRFAEGEVVFREGDAGDALYVLASTRSSTARCAPPRCARGPSASPCS